MRKECPQRRVPQVAEPCYGGKQERTGMYIKHLMTMVIMLSVALVCVGTAFAQEAELSIPAVVAPAGASVDTGVEYRANGATVAALQFDLAFDPSVLTITARAGSAATDAGKTLAQAVLPNGNILFIIFGLNQNVIADGSVVDLTIQVSKSASAGPYRVDFLNALGASPSAEAVPIIVHSGEVIVVNFAGTTGEANCQGTSVSALARQFGGIDAAAALGFASVQALQDAIQAFCAGPQRGLEEIRDRMPR